MQLLIHVTDSRLQDLYNRRLNHASDCGFDLYIRTPEGADHIVVPAKACGFKIPTGIKCSPQFEWVHGYYLYPRSSIVKTPLRLANSVGIIDHSYRGEIMAVVDNLSEEDIVLTRDRSLFQLCMPSLRPFNVQYVDSVDATVRGEGGFGSTH